MIAKVIKSDKTKRYQIRDMSKFDREKFLQNLANDLNKNAPNNDESVQNQFEKIFEIFSNNVNTKAPFKNASRKEKRLLAKTCLSRGLVNSLAHLTKQITKESKNSEGYVQ